MKQNKQFFRRLLAVAFWLAVWQATAMAIGQEVFLVSPVQALRTLVQLLPRADFWQRVCFSSGRILLGFLLGAVVSVVLAICAARWSAADALLAPVMQLVKATPVASFIILALVWVRGSALSVLISFLMVLPVLYGAVRTGIAGADVQLLEMAAVFRLPAGRRLRAIWLPAVLPAFRQGCSVALGICWKSRWRSAGRGGDKMLKLQHLTKRFGAAPLFTDLCMEVDAPVVLWASSGWGKTTLLRILMGLERPTTGSVEGVGRVAAVFQEDRLCPQLNAVQNVTLVLPGAENQYKEQITSDFQQLGMDTAALQLPARRLSGGQKRRVALLRALWAPSDTLLLDEPFTGMDPDTLQRAAALLRQRCAGKPVLLATHDESAIRALGWPVVELEKLGNS